MLVLSFFLFINAQAAASINKADTTIYPEMRSLALTTAKAEFGLAPNSNTNIVWAVIMDTTFPDGGTYTLVALSDGSASIYFSNGGGFIGGVSHKAINNAAKALVKVAAHYQAEMSKTNSFPLPKPGYTTFFLRTDAGVYASTELTENLGEKRSLLSPLFYAAQNVITQYRLINER